MRKTVDLHQHHTVLIGLTAEKSNKICISHQLNGVSSFGLGNLTVLTGGYVEYS